MARFDTRPADVDSDRPRRLRVTREPAGHAGSDPWRHVVDPFIAILPALATVALALSWPFVLVWLLLRGQFDDIADAPRPDRRTDYPSRNAAAGSDDFVIWNVALPRRSPAGNPRPGRWD
jgi:hypothetical protein